MDYIELIFNEKRHGLNHIARRILEYLDYFSLIQVKLFQYGFETN